MFWSFLWFQTQVKFHSFSTTKDSQSSWDGCVETTSLHLVKCTSVITQTSEEQPQDWVKGLFHLNYKTTVFSHIILVYSQAGSLSAETLRYGSERCLPLPQHNKATWNLVFVFVCPGHSGSSLYSLELLSTNEIVPMNLWIVTGMLLLENVNGQHCVHRNWPLTSMVLGWRKKSHRLIFEIWTRKTLELSAMLDTTFGEWDYFWWFEWTDPLNHIISGIYAFMWQKSERWDV